MGLKLEEDVIRLINDPETVKAVASADKNGVVHLVYKGSVSVTPEGTIQFLELNETSQTNKNLVYSLWFNRLISITVAGKDRRSYQIKGLPVRTIIAGKEFERQYVAVRERLGGDADLSAVWIIEPREIREETPAVRRAAERAEYPLIGHLDRFAR
ncbi:MAG: hypothetical protein LBS97_02510 [Treponema sp.]|jgi:hypothetical protein|nr:hypothetical protein [Treponema sp.]